MCLVLVELVVARPQAAAHSFCNSCFLHRWAVPVTSCLMTHAPGTLPACAGVFATAAAGAWLLPTLLQLALIGGSLWLGVMVAQAA